MIFLVNISSISDFENDAVISKFSELYCVSRDAIRYRLFQRGKISQRYYREQREDDIRKMNSKSTGGNYYYTKMSYLGQSYLKQVFSQYYSGKIQIAQVGIYTQLKAAHVSKLASNMFGGKF